MVKDSLEQGKNKKNDKKSVKKKWDFSVKKYRCFCRDATAPCKTLCFSVKKSIFLTFFIIFCIKREKVLYQLASNNVKTDWKKVSQNAVLGPLHLYINCDFWKWRRNRIWLKITNIVIKGATLQRFRVLQITKQIIYSAKNIYVIGVYIKKNFFKNIRLKKSILAYKKFNIGSYSTSWPSA